MMVIIYSFFILYSNIIQSFVKMLYLPLWCAKHSLNAKRQLFGCIGGRFMVRLESDVCASKSSAPAPPQHHISFPFSKVTIK